MVKLSGCIRVKMTVYLLMIALLSVIGAGAREASASSIPLSEALDNYKLTFSTGGAAEWFGQDIDYHSGGGSSAARSGAIKDDQRTDLVTTLTGPGTLSFWWKFESESGWDTLYVMVDGHWQQGAVHQYWEPVIINLSAGQHTVIWRYEKDFFGSYGQDCGWVDQVVWTGRPNHDLIPGARMLMLD
jgi:hypothetical protein